MKEISTKRKLLFLAFLTLTVLWMAVIYGFSDSDGEESKSHSMGISEKVALTIEPDYEIPEKYVEGDFICDVITVVRKCAHAVTYMILGILAYCTFASLVLVKGKLIKPAFFSLPIAIVYSITDEIHQSFVDGRCGTVTDVLIDAAGIFVGTAVCILAVILYYKTRRQKA